jgi:hypothetical protein
MQSGWLGQDILDWLKILFLTENGTGCRFITVDAALSIRFSPRRTGIAGEI